jgi:hypothetical protein
MEMVDSYDRDKFRARHLRDVTDGDGLPMGNDAADQAYAEAKQKLASATDEYAAKYGTRDWTAARRLPPEAPFEKTEEWVELGVKRALHEAAQGNYDRIVFTNGAQIGRSSKHVLTQDVSAVELAPHFADDFRRAPKRTKGEAWLSAFNESGERVGLAGNVVSANVAGDEIDDGYKRVQITYSDDESLLKKLREYLPPEKATEVAAKFGNKVHGKTTIGPQGMLNFYDRDVPSVVKKITGAPLEMVNVGAQEIGRGAGDNISIRLSPEMKTSISKGQRLMGVGGLVAGGLAAGATDVQAQDGSTPDSGGPGIGTLLAIGAGGYAARKALGHFAAARAAAQAGRTNALASGARVDLVELSRRAFADAQGEAKWANREERLARAAERIRNPVADYPDDVYANPKAPEDVFAFAGHIVDDVSGREEVKLATEEIVASGIVDPGGRISNDTQREIADQLGVAINDLALHDPSHVLSAPEFLALKQVHGRDMQRKALVKRVMQGAQYTQEEKELAGALFDALETRLQLSTQRLLRDSSEKGRMLQALKIEAHLSDDPSDWLYRATRLAGGRTLDIELINEITSAVQRQDWVKAQLAVQKAKGTHFLDRVGEYWQTSLLASFGRVFRDLTANSVKSVDNAVTEAVASKMDALASAFGLLPGNRVIKTSVGGALGAARKGAARGWQQAIAIMRGDAATPEQLAALERAARRYDFSNETTFKNPIMRTVATYVRRSIGAADQPFWESGFALSIESQARAMAENAGLKDMRADKFVEGLASRPTPQMAMLAMEEAAQAVWQNKTSLGDAASRLGQRSSNNPVARLAGKVILPFTQTPSAMTTEAVSRSPLGLLGDYPDLLLARAGVPEARRRLIRKLAGTGVGTAWIAAGYMLADDGAMTTSYPEDQQTRGEWSETGKIADAIKINGKWVGLTGLLGPQAMLMSMGAHMHAIMADESTSMAQAVLTANTVGIAQTLKDTPMMQGMNTVYEGVKAAGSEDPDVRMDAGARAMDSWAAGWVPRIVQQTAQASDVDENGRVIMRDPNTSDSFFGKLGDNVAAGIPGLRDNLPPKLSPLGEVRTSGVGDAPIVGRLAPLLTPMRTSVAKDDPLTAALGEADYFPSTPTKDTKMNESAEAFTTRRMAEGPEERALLTGIMQGNPDALQWVSAEAEEAYRATGSMEGLFRSALTSFRAAKTTARREAIP